MRTRKIILLTLIGVLACALVLQTVLSRPAVVKTLKLTEKPDTIVVEKVDGSVLKLAKDGGKWTVGDRAYPADQTEAGILADAIETVKVLDSVSRSGDDARYDLAEDTKMTITAKKGNTVLRTLTVGKAAATGQQSYLKIDGAKETLLVSGDFRHLFGKSEGDLRDKDIFTFKAGDFSAIGVSGAQNYRLVKSGEAGEWSVAAPKEQIAIQLDKAKVEAWLSSIGTLKADSFADENIRKDGNPFSEFSFDLGNRTAILTVIQETKDGKFVCVSSESPYPFILSEYSVKRFEKPLAELAK